jgi:hypothetical protein
MPQHNIALRNHYVPKWYQKRFLSPSASKFFYLDLYPDELSNEGRKYTRKNLLIRGPKKCFVLNDLYTLKFASWSSDDLEKRFFGTIDADGKNALEFASEYSFRDGAEKAVQDLMIFMDAQRARTPRGLDRIMKAVPSKDRNATLFLMRELFQYHQTMWIEGIWEIVKATQSTVKFLLTDEPVTFFNDKAFPYSQVCTYPSDVRLDHIGTRTLFPIDRERCLIITHAQLVRNPTANPLRPRTNARSYEHAMMDLRQIQVGRELTDDEVIRLNYILKKRAVRYIAAENADWLYPERTASVTHWSKIDNDWFLRPNPYLATFAGEIIVRFRDGRVLANDEYGRRSNDPQYSNSNQREREWISYINGQKQWARKRYASSISRNFDLGGEGGFAKLIKEDANNSKLK